MSKEAMKLALEHAKRDERHLNHAETRYWCRMYRDIAEKAVEALAKPDFWEGYVPEPVKPAQCAPAEDGVCEALDCSNHKPAQQEPVAWMSPHGGFLSANYINNFASGLDKEIHNIPLYTSPQPAQQQGFVLSKHFDKLTGAGIPNPFTFGAQQPAPVQQEPTVSKGAYNRVRDDYNDLLKQSEQDAKDAKEWRAHVNRCKLAGIDLDYQITAPQPAQQEYASFAEWAHDYVQDNLHKLKPAQRTWVGLTDEEIDQCLRVSGGSMGRLLSAIEAKLRSKNEDRN
jgi:hypothetical protein